MGEGMLQPLHLIVEIGFLVGFWMLFKALRSLWRRLMR